MAMVVKSAVRDSVKGKFNVSEDFLTALDAEIARIVKRASERAKDNGRKTLKGRDI
jgi:histone H3/H4